MTELVCRTGLDYLIDYMEGALSADLRVAIDEHVAHCAKCVAFVASYQAAPRIVRDATDVTMPASAEQALAAFLREQRE
jgi:anti-sigma factor RsiW